MSAQGFGAVVGSLLIAQILRRWNRSALILGAMGAAIAAGIGYSVANNVVVAIAFIGLVGGATAMLMGLFGGITQRDAPPEHRGRVLSLSVGANGLGLFFIGRLADGFGISNALFVGNILLLTAVTVGLIAFPRWRSLFDGGERVRPSSA